MSRPGRSAEGLAPRGVELSDAEVDEVLALMEAIGGADISEYRDAVEAVIQAKAEGSNRPRWRRQRSRGGLWT